MAWRRARHRRRRGRLWPGALLVGMIAAGVWWLAPESLRPGSIHTNLGLTPEKSALAEEVSGKTEPTPPPNAGNDARKPTEPSIPPQSPGPNPATQSNAGSTIGSATPSDPTKSAPNSATLPPAKVVELIAAGRGALAKEEWSTARAKLNQAMSASVDPTERDALRMDLNRIGQETIFSQRIIDDDPLVARHVIKIGDNLARIAGSHKLTADLLARINRLPDKNHIREGQSLKVLNGPFKAIVNKSAYTLDLFLDDVLVASFKVGLGAEDSTPTGEWRVGTKLVNPTYYPPRGGGIIAADDPKNPLGERWIGLVGISGSALGQERYGIHGTNEPDSVGKSMSMGCIRMKNEDVEQLYDCFVENDSTVLVQQQ